MGSDFQCIAKSCTYYDFTVSDLPLLEAGIGEMRGFDVCITDIYFAQASGHRPI
jgi:hypothetical protein